VTILLKPAGRSNPAPQESSVPLQATLPQQSPGAKKRSGAQRAVGTGVTVSGTGAGAPIGVPPCRCLGIRHCSWRSNSHRRRSSPRSCRSGRGQRRCKQVLGKPVKPSSSEDFVHKLEAYLAKYKWKLLSTENTAVVDQSTDYGEEVNQDDR